MTNPRMATLAQLLVRYWLETKPGQQALICTSPPADERTLAVRASCPQTGGRNVSGLHRDRLGGKSVAGILVDDECFRENGHPVI